MPRRGGSVHVATVKTKGRGKNPNEYVSHLLRRSYREGGKVKHETLGNLSHLPEPIIEAIRKMLAGTTLVDLDEQFQITRLAAARARGRGSAAGARARPRAAVVAGALPRAGSVGGDDLSAGDRRGLEAVDDPPVLPDDVG